MLKFCGEPPRQRNIQKRMTEKVRCMCKVFKFCLSYQPHSHHLVRCYLLFSLPSTVYCVNNIWLHFALVWFPTQELELTAVPFLGLAGLNGDLV